MSTNSPLRIWLLAGACSVLMAAAVVTISMPAVQANALLPRSIATAPPGLPISSATPASLTACHPTLPFGSLVRVVNRENKRSVVVRITDRGYLYDGRILDLSYGAAQKLAMIKPGTTRVDLEVISRGESNHRKK